MNVDIIALTDEEYAQFQHEKNEVILFNREISHRLIGEGELGGVFWRAIKIANFAIKHMKKTETEEHIEFLLRTHKLDILS